MDTADLMRVAPTLRWIDRNQLEPFVQFTEAGSIARSMAAVSRLADAQLGVAARMLGTASPLAQTVSRLATAYQPAFRVAEFASAMSMPQFEALRRIGEQMTVLRPAGVTYRPAIEAPAEVDPATDTRLPVTYEPTLALHQVVCECAIAVIRWAATNPSVRAAGAATVLCSIGFVMLAMGRTSPATLVYELTLALLLAAVANSGTGCR